MKQTSKKAYIYKMNLVPANIISIVVFFLLIFFTYFFIGEFILTKEYNVFIFFLSILAYLALHEFLHGIGYFVGGMPRENIQYGICLEKGIFYAMAYQEISKKNILISLQMPFMVIGVITYVMGLVFSYPFLVLLSIINITGASMDIAMFFYILRLPKDITYSESGRPDEFVLISKEDLKNRKSYLFRILEEKEYKKKDYQFGPIQKLVISKFSYIFLGVFLLLGILLSLLN